MKIDDIFYLIRGKVISQQDVYSNIIKLISGKRYPLYSSKTTEKGLFGFLPYAMFPERVIKKNIKSLNYLKEISPDNFKSITWTTDGIYAGTMFVRNGQYNTTNVCGSMILKQEFKDKVNLDWFVRKYQGKVYNEKKSVDTNGKVMNRVLKEIKVDIPPMEEQLSQLERFNRLDKIKDTLRKFIEKTDKVLSRIVSVNNVKKYKISDIFLLGRGQRIIKEDIYNKLLLNKETNDEDIIPIVSSGVEDDILGYGSIKWLKNIVRKRKSYNNDWDTWRDEIGANYIINRPCVTWNTDGAAGTLFYRNYKFYPTDHCGILIPKSKYEDEINLKYFALLNKKKYKQNIDRGNLHLKEMANMPVELPDIKIQNKIYSKYERLYRIKEKLELCLKNVEEITNKTIN